MRKGVVEDIVMNANDFLMSLIVVGLAALGGYGQEVRAEPSAQIATAAEQPVQSSGEASNEMREAKEAAGELLDDSLITAKVKGKRLQDVGTSIGRVQPSGSVDSVDEKQRAKDIAERVDGVRVDGVIGVDNALSWAMRYP
jgi:osmotically-inducible protein OsmY